MQITSNSLSLLSYIGENNIKSNDLLRGIAEDNSKDVGGVIDVLVSGLNKGAFGETLQLMNKGEIDLKLAENCYHFNQQKLNRDVAQLAGNFELGSAVTVKLEGEELFVEGESDNAKALQKYFDKDNGLRVLVQQTAKLSQFVEWGQAKEQAAEYKSNDMPEAKLLDFLKEARLLVTQSNQFIMSDKGSAIYSQGHTQYLIDKMSKETQ